MGFETPHPRFLGLAGLPVSVPSSTVGTSKPTKRQAAYEGPRKRKRVFLECGSRDSRIRKFACFLLQRRDCFGLAVIDGPGTWVAFATFVLAGVGDRFPLLASRAPPFVSNKARLIATRCSLCVPHAGLFVFRLFTSTWRASGAMASRRSTPPSA
jgi:hypothetical protein